MLKKVNKPGRFGPSPSSVGVKLQLMFVGGCATKPYFKMKFKDARETNSNKTEVSVESVRLTGSQFEKGGSPSVTFVACFRYRA